MLRETDTKGREFSSAQTRPFDSSVLTEKRSVVITKTLYRGFFYLGNVCFLCSSFSFFNYFFWDLLELFWV